MTTLRALVAVFAAWAFYRAGAEMGARYFARERQLREIRSALRALETEIVYGRTLLPDACARLSSTLGAGGRLLAGFGEALADEPTALAAWAAAVNSLGPDLALDDEDRRILVSLGPCLGQSDPTDQAAHLALVREMLAEREQAAAAEARRSGRLWGYLGVLGGLGFVLLVW